MLRAEEEALDTAEIGVGGTLCCDARLRSCGDWMMIPSP